MNELHELGSQVGEVAEKFNIPRSNLFTWEKQLSCQNKEIPSNTLGKNLKSVIGRGLSYPKQIR